MRFLSVGWNQAGEGLGELDVRVSKIVEMKVPKRWFLRPSRDLGLEQPVIVKAGSLENRCERYMFGMLVDIKFAQYP